jgi:hypothetical protein
VTATQVVPGAQPEDDAVVTFKPVDARSESVSVAALLAISEIVQTMSSSGLPAGIVGVSERTPSLSTALPASRTVAAAVRQALLSRAEKPPVGPVDLGG